MPNQAAVKRRALQVRLAKLTLEDYARDVLPHSAALWAAGRNLERYAADLRDFASSDYGRRCFGLVGIRMDDAVVSSCKTYRREIRCGELVLRAIGIGAVFTRATHRGRGLATAMIAALLDEERRAGCDVAFLFSDIRPHFYEDLGFVALPSRTMSVRAASLPFARVDPSPLADADWPAAARCFAALEAGRRFALRRTPLVWGVVRSRVAARGTKALNLAVRSGRRIVAYCLGCRDTAADAYVVEEFAFAGEEYAHLAAPLLRAAAGDLRKIVGWLPPQPARDALAAVTARARRHAIFMLAPLSPAARTAWQVVRREVVLAGGDPVWSTDHI
jgi:GNAT superfamily N-acetyltransferase